MGRKREKWRESSIVILIDFLFPILQDWFTSCQSLLLRSSQWESGPKSIEKRTVSSLPLLFLLLALSYAPSPSPPVKLFDWRTTTATDLRFIMRMFEHNRLLSVLGVGEGEEVLDFHQCPALGLNKAIVLPGPERVQKGTQWIWVQKWAHSGHHSEQVPMTDCLCPSLCQHGRGLWVRWPTGVWILEYTHQRDRERVHRKVITWQWDRGELCDLHLVSLTQMSVRVCVRIEVPKQSGWEGGKGFRKSPCMQMPSGCTVHWCNSH